MSHGTCGFIYDDMFMLGIFGQMSCRGQIQRNPAFWLINQRTTLERYDSVKPCGTTYDEGITRESDTRAQRGDLGRLTLGTAHPPIRVDR